EEVSPPASARASFSESDTEKKIEELLRKMTLEEKVGQLVQYSAGQPTGPGTGRTDYDDMIRKGEVGALFNITTAHQVNAFQHIAERPDLALANHVVIVGAAGAGSSRLT